MFNLWPRPVCTVCNYIATFSWGSLCVAQSVNWHSMWNKLVQKNNRSWQLARRWAERAGGQIKLLSKATTANGILIQFECAVRAALSLVLIHLLPCYLSRLLAVSFHRSVQFSLSLSINVDILRAWTVKVEVWCACASLFFMSFRRFLCFRFGHSRTPSPAPFCVM